MTNDNKKLSNKSDKKLKTHVTYLEMTATPLRSIPVPTRPRIALMRAENIPTNFYNYLYEQIGRKHHWENRRYMLPAKLDNLINDENTEISILYADGCPAGFFELSTAAMPQKVEIIYLGLIPEYQGLGLGKWFVSAAISAAWNYKPEKVTIETNTLDHPAALRIYQRLGFSPVGTATEYISEWL